MNNLIMSDILERNIEATTNYFGYNLQIPSYMPEDYVVRDVKSRDHDVLGNRVYGNGL